MDGRWWWREWDYRYTAFAPTGYWYDIRYHAWWVQVTINANTGEWVWNRASNFAIRQIIFWHNWLFAREMCRHLYGRYGRCSGGRWC